MLTSIPGIYKDGEIELLENPPDLDKVRGIVTFLPDEKESEARMIDLRTRGISERPKRQIFGFV